MHGVSCPCTDNPHIEAFPFDLCQISLPPTDYLQENRGYAAVAKPQDLLYGVDKYGTSGTDFNGEPGCGFWVMSLRGGSTLDSQGWDSAARARIPEVTHYRHLKTTGCFCETDAEGNADYARCRCRSGCARDGSTPGCGKPVKKEYCVWCCKQHGLQKEENDGQFVAHNIWPQGMEGPEEACEAMRMDVGKVTYLAEPKPPSMIDPAKYESWPKTQTMLTMGHSVSRFVTDKAKQLVSNQADAEEASVPKAASNISKGVAEETFGPQMFQCTAG